jgi:predicted ATPase/DNA-binding CsgD family transcriptional regulator
MVRGIHGNAWEELNAFIGRERELGELRELAQSSRALTLCGAAGIGKTRLALHLMSELAAGYSDGTWFVELADLRQPDLVVARIASALGVAEEPGRPLLDTLADTLRQRHALVGLDNCEHLVDACARVCHRLLASSPGLRVIATSREPLRVAAETIWQVPPLSLPSPSAQEPAAVSLAADGDATRSDALRLFADRAAAVKPGFALAPGNLGPVSAICRALDGLPLAIELAAAWVRALTVDQIEARLADRFRLLSSAERTAPPRHRTLRAAIDWSHELLTPDEKILMRRLAVFAGWSLDMAEQVCGGPLCQNRAAAPELAEPAILDLHISLSDKSLVVAEPDEHHPGRIRYRMLDTIREYAAEKLDQAGEAGLMHARFRGYVMAEAEYMEHIGMAKGEAPWSDRVQIFRRHEAEAANVRQILGRCLAEGDAEPGLRICTAIRPAWIVQGSFAEGIAWTDSFLGLDRTGLPDRVLGAGLITRAQLALAPDPAGAQEHALAGLELCRGEGAEFWAASALNLLAEAALHAGEVGEAIARADEAMAVASKSGDRWNEGYASATRAAIAGYQGDLGEAMRLGEAALAVMREIDQQWGSAKALLGLGDLARLTGDPNAARQRYQQALPILREVNARPEIARCLAGLGRLAISQGELALARRHLTESIELSRSSGSRIGVIRALEAFTTLAIAEDDPVLAVRLAAAAAAIRRATELPGGSPASWSRRVLDVAARLGDEVIGELWAEGSTLSSDAAVALAVGDRPAGPGAARSAGRPAGLTPRELEIVALISQGLSNRAIAEALFISQATAARHVANIMAKLGFASRVQVAAWALGQAARPPQSPEDDQGPRALAEGIAPRVSTMGASCYCGSNRALTDSPSWIRLIASASAGATEMTCSFSLPSASLMATEFVQTICITSGHAAMRLSAPSQNRPWVQAIHTERAPCSRSLPSNSIVVVPLAISSSSTITSRPATSPMIEVIVTWSSLSRSFAPAATGRLSIRASAAACFALPRSGDTTTVPDRSWPLKWSAISRSACRWSTGTEKKPCTCGACSVIVSTRLAPAVTSRSATSRPPIETLGMAFLSDRAYA